MTDFKIADPLLKKIVYAVGIMGLIAFGFYTFSLLKPSIVLVMNVLTPFLAAMLMAYILAPIVFILQNQLKLGRVMGTLVLYIIIFSMFFILLAFLIPNVIEEFIKLFNFLKVAIPPFLKNIAHNRIFKINPEIIDNIQKWIENIKIDYQKIFANILPALKKIASGGFEAVGVATMGIFSGVSSIVGFVSFLIFVGIINFYLILDWEKIRPTIQKMVPPARREKFLDILNKMDIAVGGFLRGQLTVSAIVGLLFAVGLFGMGFIGFPALRNYCILIGTIAAIGGFIPYLGPIMGVSPAIIIVLFTRGVPWSVKLITLASVLVLFAIIQGIEGFILQPKIVGKGAGLHPLAVMFALLFGAQFGIGGMIAAVPAASVIRVLIREFYWIPIEKREAALAGITDLPEEK